MRAVQLIACLSAVISTACNGFPDSEPIGQAERKAERYPSYMATTAVPITTGPQHWLLLPGTNVVAPMQSLRPLAGATQQLFVPSWDRPPYDGLYGRGSDGRIYLAAEIR